MAKCIPDLVSAPLCPTESGLKSHVTGSPSQHGTWQCQASNARTAMRGPETAPPSNKSRLNALAPQVHGGVEGHLVGFWCAGFNMTPFYGHSWGHTITLKLGLRHCLWNWLSVRITWNYTETGPVTLSRNLTDPLRWSCSQSLTPAWWIALTISKPSCDLIALTTLLVTGSP